MKKIARYVLSLCAAGLLPTAASVAHAGVEIIPTHGRNIYRLAVAELDGQAAAKEIVGSPYDNRVCAFAIDGKHLWDAPVGGFVFDLAAGDLDGDGRDEIVAAGADGLVTVFDAAGRKRWTADLQAPVYQVAIARLDGKTPVVLAGGVSRQVVAFAANGRRLTAVDLDGAVRTMQAGDFDGDGKDEIAVVPATGVRGYRSPPSLLFFQESSLAKMTEAGQRGPLAAYHPVPAAANANGTVADLDGDGSAELFYNSGVHTLKGGLRPLLTLPPKHMELSYDHHYTMQLLAAGDLTDRPGTETVVINGAQVRLCDATGKELGHAVAAFGFTDVVYVPGAPHGSVLLGSSPNGDDNLYRLTFTPGWEKSLEQLERRGLMAGIGATLQDLGGAARQWKGEPMRGADGPYDIVVAHGLDQPAGGHLWNNAEDPRPFDLWVSEVREYEKLFPYPRLRFSTNFWPGENAPLLRPDGKPWDRDRRLAHDLTREQIIDGAKYLEAARCPFWVQVGHACSPHLEIATVAAMLEAAPTMLLGFVSAEDFQPDQVPYYMEHHIKPILELCLQHQKRFILRNKGIWWAHWPADPQVRELIFNGRYRSVILPSVEDSNSRSPDVNLAARVGLWLDGQVDDWASRCSADWYSFNRLWEWEYPLTGHPALRYNVAQAMLGARVFMMLNGESERSTGRWTRTGTEGTATFLHLLGRGAITPPKREQLRGISPVALAMQPPAERFAKHGGNYHQLQDWGNDSADAKPWAFDRLDCYWGMAPLPPTDVSTYLWGRTRRDASHLPTTTPHGFVALVPGGISRPDSPWKTMWTTDGDTLSKDGRNYSLPEARIAMLADLAAAEKSLPFHVEGRVFHQVVEQSPGRYIVALIDSGWLDPAERTVKLTARLPGTWKLTDRLSGQTLGTLASPVELRVPAGALRLLEARRE
ncbi:MAG: hypothetical protein RL091_1228 [Verrucomicrobiota bacterium]|jgi:hypothetical protein